MEIPMVRLCPLCRGSGIFLLPVIERNIVGERVVRKWARHFCFTCYGDGVVVDIAVVDAVAEEFGALGKEYKASVLRHMLYQQERGLHCRE